MIRRRQQTTILKLTALVALALASGSAQRPSSVPLQDQAAQVVQMTGQVSVLRDGNPWALQVGDSVQVRQTVVTGPGGYAVFKVFDGSTIEVFPNSHFVFRSNLGNWKDLLDLVLGRVRVQIQHLGGLPNPNNIHTPTAVISVRGTVFDVSVEEEDGTTLVQVEEGLVAVKHAKLSGQRLVSAGEYLRVFPSQPLAQATIDKGGAMRQVVDVARRAIIDILQRRPAGGVGSGTSGAGQPLPGDKDSTKAPPAGGGGTGGGPPAPPSAPPGGGSSGGGPGAPPAPPPPPND